MKNLIATLFLLFGCLILTLTYFNTFTEPDNIRWLAGGLITIGLSIFTNELLKISKEQDEQITTEKLKNS
ncbi:hypothetical protein [Paenisporosarcina sp.]|uniref:hypothetical protein n=1 Tax=Paenisporosarcina sp. TaxID=1932001 RepID=UPI003C7951A8